MTDLIKERIQDYWKSKRDHIFLSDAILEARNDGYDETSIKELKVAYNELEAFQ